MAVISAIAGAISSVKMLGDIVKAMVNLRDAEAFKVKLREIQSAIIDAQDGLLAVQSAQFALADEVRQAKEKLAKTKNCEQKRYQLVGFKGGAFAYSIKPSMQGVEPAHYICAHCHEHGLKSVLQGLQSATFGHQLSCPECKLEISSD
jgi:hypothetical protein